MSSAWMIAIEVVFAPNEGRAKVHSSWGGREIDGEGRDQLIRPPVTRY